MEKEKVISLLNRDIEDEHGAIIQYLAHAYGMGEGEVACEIEAIARDEMRHFDWLAETIVELGGIPSLERGKMLMGDGAVANWMTNDVTLEVGAVKQYREQIAVMDDPAIKRLLERIVSDEESHRDTFQNLVGKVQETGLTDIRGERQDNDTRLLNWGIEHEYTVILQYLVHSYMARSEKARKELADQAINEMQHMGWLSEKTVDSGGKPVLEHSQVYWGYQTADQLQEDIKIEREVAAEYDRAGNETSDPGLRKLLHRIRDNEMYHIGVFGDLLKRPRDNQSDDGKV